MENTLNTFSPGEKGKVIKITADGSAKRRLYDMGITPGVEIVMRKSAPMGDPIEITVRGYELSIRKTQAETIFITKEEKSDELRVSRKSKFRENNAV